MTLSRPALLALAWLRDHKVDRSGVWPIDSEPAKHTHIYFGGYEWTKVPVATWRQIHHLADCNMGAWTVNAAGLAALEREGM